ncbi:hypothetical protein SLEP1_g40260 [Rubroshorea leprosula]|uniref:Uncharacterized protein n=1 Tax=Rubroshorea leprosula TaxID=152421 RepID=A0AAV5L3B2_9ROSI|nr:hypothetical protein SLEP1_g40260 [Rubroshorea leprosula]
MRLITTDRLLYPSISVITFSTLFWCLASSTLLSLTSLGVRRRHHYLCTVLWFFLYFPLYRSLASYLPRLSICDLISALRSPDISFVSQY